jgi:hypothetical protein
MAAAGLPILTAPAPASATEPGPSLQGSWQIEATLRMDGPDCTVAPIIGVDVNPFRQFYNFNAGGTLNEWGTRTPPATRGAGHGIWKRTGANTFAFRDMFHTFDANGLQAGTLDIRTNTRVSKSGKRFAGISRFVLTDISGIEQRFCATMTGTRITF